MITKKLCFVADEKVYLFFDSEKKFRNDFDCIGEEVLEKKYSCKLRNFGTTLIDEMKKTATTTTTKRNLSSQINNIIICGLRKNKPVSKLY